MKADPSPLDPKLDDDLARGLAVYLALLPPIRHDGPRLPADTAVRTGIDDEGLLAGRPGHPTTPALSTTWSLIARAWSNMPGATSSSVPRIGEGQTPDAAFACEAARVLEYREFVLGILRELDETKAELAKFHRLTDAGLEIFDLMVGRHKRAGR